MPTPAPMRHPLTVATVVVAVLMAGGMALAENAEVPEPDAEDASPWVQSIPEPYDPDPMVIAAPAGERDPRLAVLLAADPGRDVVICIAGCGRGPMIVAVQRPREPKLQTMASGGPDTATAGTRDDPSMPAVSRAASGGAMPGPTPPTFGDVVCIAGCPGAPGQIVYRGARLAWIDEDAGEELRAALRAVADRLSRPPEEQANPRQWMSAGAREALLGEQIHDVLAALVRSALPLVGQHGAFAR